MSICNHIHHRIVGKLICACTTFEYLRYCYIVNQTKFIESVSYIEKL